ncbi:MAG: 50S ribosomal protein L23 [Rickettsiales bacterium]|jgi:large subunit ribosomal protein L23|nr:50S ribosomal protein L23 [Rickettsiales bacterium]
MENVAKITEKTYCVLLRPLVTEKTSAQSEHSKVAFEIAPSATKKDVKSAVEAIYKVSVKGVNIINVAAKKTRFRGISGKTKSMKKAYVSLAGDAKIDLSAEVR